MWGSKLLCRFRLSVRGTYQSPPALQDPFGSWSRNPESYTLNLTPSTLKPQPRYPDPARKIWRPHCTKQHQAGGESDCVPQCKLTIMSPTLLGLMSQTSGFFCLLGSRNHVFFGWKGRGGGGGAFVSLETDSA